MSAREVSQSDLQECLEAPTDAKELLEVLEDVLTQAAWNPRPTRLKADTDGKDEYSISVGGHFDSMALSAYADGLRLLAKLGKVKIVSQYGRRVIAVPADATPKEKEPGR